MIIKPNIYNPEAKQINALTKKYKNKKPLFQKALSDLTQKIGEIKRSHEGGARLRIAYIDGRIKSLHSIIRKAVNRKLPASNLFDNIGDIVGVRIVVNNLKDVSQLIKEIERISGLTIQSRKKCVYKNGYRALHLEAVLSVTYRRKYKGKQPRLRRTKFNVKCEIQVRSLLQDAWAILTHHDVYKNSADLPEFADTIAENISQLLASIDKMADDFRRKIEVRVKQPNDLSQDAPMDREGVAFLYYELFGESPQEYEVEYILRIVSDLGIKNIKTARIGVNETVFQRLRRINNKRFPVDASNLDLFQYGLSYTVNGRFAYTEYRKKVEEDWAEVVAVGRQEALSGMPETLREFVLDLDMDEIPWEALKELEVIKDCNHCGIDMLESYDAAEIILDYYEFPETDIDLVSKFEKFKIRHGFDSESDEISGGICQGCGDRMLHDED